MNTQRICVWSGPRNVATALMYAFAQRSDTHVLDEPLYPYYLRRTGVAHPGREEVLSSMESQADSIISEQILGPYQDSVLYIKEMPHHLVGLDMTFLHALKHVFLIRNPMEALPSLLQHIPSPKLLDTAYKMQFALYQRFVKSGHFPLVIDAGDLLKDPESCLRKICSYVGLKFQPKMLHWNPGSLPQEGIWGKYWYEHVHQSSGFFPYEQKKRDIPAHLEPLLEECYSYYLRLYEYSFISNEHGPSSLILS